MLTRRSLLASLAVLVPAPLLAMFPAKPEKKKWQAVMMVGIGEDGVMSVELVNKAKKPVHIIVQGIQIQQERGLTAPLDVHAIERKDGAGFTAIWYQDQQVNQICWGSNGLRTELPRSKKSPRSKSSV